MNSIITNKKRIYPRIHFHYANTNHQEESAQKEIPREFSFQFIFPSAFHFHFQCLHALIDVICIAVCAHINWHEKGAEIISREYSFLV
jgi:hypothetical protein